MGGAGWGREHFRSLVCFWVLGWVAGSKGATVAAAAGSSGGVGKSCEAAAGSCAGWSAAPSCGCGSGRCALGGALPRARRGAARRGGRTGMGIRETRVGAVVPECVGGMGRAELRAPQSLGQVESQKRPCERVESGLWRARSQRRQPPRRRGPKGRAPARELQAGGAPSDPQGAGCRDIGPQRTRSGASGSPSGRNPGLGSLTLPGAPCLSGVERPETRGMKAIGFRAEAARRPPPIPHSSRRSVG